ncbi:MAG: hypothetical protein LBV45_09225, partial [Xanthomonadaceae bacterium]|nr:hypothetical protein [Xanthomonadaceae bacterium]
LRRVETCFPILERELIQRTFRETLQNYLDDNLNAWELDSDGRYHRCFPKDKERPHSAQASLLTGL